MIENFFFLSLIRFSSYFSHNIFVFCHYLFVTKINMTKEFYFSIHRSSRFIFFAEKFIFTAKSDDFLYKERITFTIILILKYLYSLLWICYSFGIILMKSFQVIKFSGSSIINENFENFPIKFFLIYFLFV